MNKAIASAFLSMTLFLGCARVPQYSGVFQGPALNLRLVDAKSNIVHATAIVIEKADYFSKRPANEIAGLRTILVSRRNKCLNLLKDDGQMLQVKGTATSWPLKNPDTGAFMVRTYGRTNLFEVFHVIKVKSIRPIPVGNSVKYSVSAWRRGSSL